jgi:hypothetical protein
LGPDSSISFRNQGPSSKFENLKKSSEKTWAHKIGYRNSS